MTEEVGFQSLSADTEAVLNDNNNKRLETESKDAETTNTKTIADVDAADSSKCSPNDDRSKSKKKKLVSFLKERDNYTANVDKDNMEELALNINLWANSIYDFKNTEQTFSAWFEFAIRRELSFREMEEYKNNKDEFEPKLLSFWGTNCVKVEHMEPFRFFNGKPYIVHYDAWRETMFVYQLWLCNMVFTESMELENFPFDVQHCRMDFQLDARDVVWSSDSRRDIRFVDDNESKFVIASTTLEGCAFETHCHQTIGLRLNDPHWSNGRIAIFQAGFAVERHWKFYVRNVFLVLSILSFLSNMCFLFGDIEDTVSDRFDFISTTLLTIVAFIFIIREYVPRLSYMTLVDWYIFITLAYIVCIAIENLLLSIIDSMEVDEYVLFGTNLVIWLVIHIGFVIKGVRARNVELKKFDLFKHEVDGTEWKGTGIKASGQKIEGKHDRFKEIDGARLYLRNGRDLKWFG